jgi:hypothetical protein
LSCGVEIYRSFAYAPKDLYDKIANSLLIEFRVLFIPKLLPKEEKQYPKKPDGKKTKPFDKLRNFGP